MSDLNIENYSEESVESYEHCAAVRERPTMYIEELGSRGVLRLAYEGVGNFLDEFRAKRCTAGVVEIDENSSRITISDDGAGIPLGKLVNCFTKLHTGAKFKSKAYNMSIGLNGVGLKAINALSTELHVEVCRDGKLATFDASKGVIINGPNITTAPKNRPTGTSISFIPDITIFEDITVKSSWYQDYLKKIAYINPGIKIHYTAHLKNGKTVKELYYSKNGISDYLKDEILTSHKPVISSIVDIPLYGETVSVDKHGENVNVNMSISIAFTWCSDVRTCDILSFVNGIQTSNGGFHVSGFRTGVGDVIRNDIKNGNFISKKDPLYEFVNRDDFFEGMVAIINANHEKPLFDGQTKNRFSSSDFEDFAKKVSGAKFKEWTDNNKTKYAAIIAHILLSAKARYAATKARNLIRTSASSSSSVLSEIKQYSGCSSRNPDECELFLVEGESAGGSAKIGGNNKTQAIYKTTGKPANVYGLSSIDPVLKQDVRNSIKDIITILGCGIGKTFDMSKLRFNKIIIMTDADPDGAHIASLLTGFFYAYYIELIKAGKIYIANPPLYEFSFNNGKRTMYITNMAEYHQVLENTIIKEFDLCAVKNKTCVPIKNKKFFKSFLYTIRGYSDLITSVSNQIGINVKLIESILIYYNDIVNHKSVLIHNNKLSVTKVNNAYEIEGIYDNVYCKLLIDEFFITVCKPVIDQLNNIKWSNLILKHKKTGKLIGPSIYQITSSINYLINNNTQIGRFKGLGEMPPKKLWTTTMDPETRKLSKLVVDDSKVEEYKKHLDILIGNDIAGRKDYYRQYLG